jgi:outer membrane protein TolC
MTRLSYAITLLVYLAFAKAYSQQTPAQSQGYSFTLDQAIEFALENNYQAINARREIAKALKQKWETTATGLPQINGEIGYNYNIEVPLNPVPAQFFDPDAQPGEFAAVPFAPVQSANLTATLTQLIFDGSYLVALEASETFLQFSENANNKTKLEVRKGIINAYGGVLLAQENVDIITKNLETVNENLEETQIIFENGLTEEEDVEQLQITALQLNNQLNGAVRQTEIAMDMLQLAMGINLAATVTLQDDLNSLAQNNIDLGITNQNLELEKSVDYQIAYNMTEQRRLEYKLERAKALPTVGAFVNYGINSFGEEFVFFDRDNPWFDQSTAGLSISVPIFSSFGRRAAQQRTKLAWDQAETDLDRISEEVRLNYASAMNEYQLSIDTYYTSKKNLEIAQRIENKNSIKFTEGIASSFELRQAQTQLYQAQSEYLNSMFQVITNKAQLETVLNTPNFISTDND